MHVVRREHVRPRVVPWRAAAVVFACNGEARAQGVVVASAHADLSRNRRVRGVAICCGAATFQRTLHSLSTRSVNTWAGRVFALFLDGPVSKRV